MVASANWFSNAFDQAFSGGINWASDSIKMALLDPAYTPDLTAVHFSDLSAHEITGTGYTAGGQPLATKTHTVTQANSFGSSWAATTAYAVGAVIRPATGNGYLYLCEVAGTSGSAAPTWPTLPGQTVSDGTVTWSCLGESIFQLGSASPSWATATFSTAFGVIYDAQTGVAATEPLICLAQFGVTESPSASTFSVTCPSLGWAWLTPA